MMLKSDFFVIFDQFGLIVVVADVGAVVACLYEVLEKMERSNHAETLFDRTAL
jgi:hypothetical protein